MCVSVYVYVCVSNALFIVVKWQMENCGCRFWALTYASFVRCATRSDSAWQFDCAIYGHKLHYNNNNYNNNYNNNNNKHNNNCNTKRVQSYFVIRQTTESVINKGVRLGVRVCVCVYARVCFYVCVCLIEFRIWR